MESGLAGLEAPGEGEEGRGEAFLLLGARPGVAGERSTGGSGVTLAKMKENGYLWGSMHLTEMAGG